MNESCHAYGWVMSPRNFRIFKVCVELKCHTTPSVKRNPHTNKKSQTQHYTDLHSLLSRAIPLLSGFFPYSPAKWAVQHLTLLVRRSLRHRHVWYDSFACVTCMLGVCDETLRVCAVTPRVYDVTLHVCHVTHRVNTGLYWQKSLSMTSECQWECQW